MDKSILLIVRKYKRDKLDKEFWECKIIYKDPFSHRTRKKVLRNFKNKSEAERAAKELMFYLDPKQ